MKYELYEVGGKIRDEFLGLSSKDVDYSVVIDTTANIDVIFKAFVTVLKYEKYEVFLETPDCFTVRAKFPEHHKYSGVADFVLARKELYYPTNGRKPVSELGTLYDDLRRRDFTINAMAKGIDDKIIDPFAGYEDLMVGILKTPGNTIESFNDDPLRILRALRFSITKDLMFSDAIMDTLRIYDAKRMKVVSEERIREELHKMFAHNTVSTLDSLLWLQKMNYKLFEAIFDNNIWLMPTNKK